MKPIKEFPPLGSSRTWAFAAAAALGALIWSHYFPMGFAS